MTDLVAPSTRAPAPGQRTITYVSAQVQLGASATDIFVPANSTNLFTGQVTGLAFLVDMWIANTDTSDRQVTLYLVPSGGSAGAGNTIVPASTVKGATGTGTAQGLHFSGMETLIPQGGKLQGLGSSASKITVSATIKLVS